MNPTEGSVSYRST